MTQGDDFKNSRTLGYHVALLILVVTIVAPGSSGWSVVIPPNVRVSGHRTGIQNEEQVWICPENPNIVVANHRDFRLGYRQIAIARSIDGGATWADTLISTAFQKFKLQSDPAMTVTSDGDYVIAHLDYETSGSTTRDSSFVSILRSSDYGASWTGPYTIVDTFGDFFEDKVFITSDRTGGVHDGSVYASWTRGTDSASIIMFARSPDGGITWNDPVVVGPQSYSTYFMDSLAAGQFSQPLVGGDGAVYVFWRGLFSSGSSLYFVMRMNKSTDGGVTWAGQRTLLTFFGVGLIEGNIDTYNQPVTDADISDGPHAGSLYVQFIDNTTVEPFHEEIWFQRSLDTGHTWWTPIRVNDDPTGPEVDQFHNWMVCNEEGILSSIWYDQRTDPSHFKFDVFAAYSYDGGGTWTSNHRVSSVSIDPLLLATNSEPQSRLPSSAGIENALGPYAPMAGKIAEYIGLACSHDKVVAVWTDTRDGDQDVWSARWSLPLTDPRLLTDSGVALSCSDTLRWSTAWKEAEDLYLVQIATSESFATENLVAVGFSQRNFQPVPPGLPAGSLYWRLKAYRAPSGVQIDSTAFSAARNFTYASCPCSCDCHRDPMCDSATDIIDLVSTVDVAFNNVPASGDPSGSCPHKRTDVDCNSVTDVIDVVLMVNVVYREIPLGLGFCGSCD